MPAEQAAQRFRVGDVPPLAEGYTDRPDTARGIVDALVPGATLALVPGSAFAEGPSNWLGACGKTQIAVIIAESLWRSAGIDALIWISATNRASVLSAYMQGSVAATGIEPTGTAESVAARFISWLAETDQRWLVVLDDVPDSADLEGLWPEGPTGRVLITSSHSSVASGRRGTQVIPVGFFSVREALNCLTERLSANPTQRQGAIDLIEALGREPLALAQASQVVANSTLACRDYRDYFNRRRQQIGVAAGEVPSAAAVTWTLSLGQAESLLPGASIRLMLVILALLDGHGIPGTIFSTPSVAAYLGGAVTPFSSAVDSKPAWDALIAIERAGLISVNRAVAPPSDLDELGAPGGDQVGGARERTGPRGASGRQRAARRLARRGGAAVGSRQLAGERGQPAKLGGRCAVGRRMPSATAAGRSQPRRRAPSRAGR